MKLIHNYFPERLKIAVKNAALNENLTEIRVRMGKPLVFRYIYGNCFVNKNNEFTKNVSNALCADKEEIDEIISLMIENSVYAYRDEMNCGFITLREGHRAGVCGKYSKESGMRDITSVNIRISRQIKGVSDKLTEKIKDKNVLLISPPGCGKTTYLRDIARNLSLEGKNVGIVDERCEIAPIKEFKEVYDTGINTDILRDIKKSEGMSILLRTMNPDVIITDEIALAEDFKAVLETINSGVNVISSFHAGSIREYENRIKIMEIDKDYFDLKILLNKNFEATVC